MITLKLLPLLHYVVLTPHYSRKSLSLSLLSSMSLKLYDVVEYVVESMHTHIKLGAYALLNV